MEKCCNSSLHESVGNETALMSEVENARVNNDKINETEDNEKLSQCISSDTANLSSQNEPSETAKIYKKTSKNESVSVNSRDKNGEFLDTETTSKNNEKLLMENGNGQQDITTSNGAHISAKIHMDDTLETGEKQNYNVDHIEILRHTETSEEIGLRSVGEGNSECNSDIFVIEKDASGNEYLRFLGNQDIRKTDDSDDEKNVKNHDLQCSSKNVNGVSGDCKNCSITCSNYISTEIQRGRDFSNNVKNSETDMQKNSIGLNDSNISTHMHADETSPLNVNSRETTVYSYGDRRTMLIVEDVKNGDIKLTVRIDKGFLTGRNIKVDVIIDGSVNTAYETTDTISNNCEEKVQQSQLQARESHVTFNTVKNSVTSTKSKQRNVLSASGVGTPGCGSLQNPSWKGAKTDRQKNAPAVPKRTLKIYGETEIIMSKWEGIVKEQRYYSLPSCIIRHITSKDKRRFVDILRRGSTTSNINAWMNLTRRLDGKEKWLWGISDNTQGVDNLYLGISQFYKGGYAKSFASLLNRQMEEVKLTKEQVTELFPRMGDQWRIDQIQCSQQENILFTPVELQYILKSNSLPNGKATGLSGLSYEIIRKVCGGKEANAIMAKMLNEMLLDPRVITQQLTTARLIGIRKSNGGVRPLCVQETLIKVLNKILTLKITSEIRESLIPTQKCMARSEGQVLARDQVKGYMEDGFDCIIQFDFKNAFGTIDRRMIIQRLLHYGIKKAFINYIIFMLNNQKVVYETETGHEMMEIETGVPQGEPMSMVLFAIGIDKLLQEMDEIEGVGVTAYADDVVLAVRKLADVEKIKKTFADKAKLYGLSLNKNKTCIGYTRRITEVELEKLGENGGTIIDLKKENTTYVGLPLTLNKEKELEFIKGKIQKTVELSSQLWELRAPLQVKYHLQRMCVDTELDYVMKATKWDDSYDGVWLKETQKRLNSIWEPITKIVPTKFLRLPVKYYGVGMLNVKDRWKTARRTYEARTNGSKKDEVLEYYKEKYDKWTRKGYVPKMEIEKIPSRTNISLSAPPASKQHRLKEDEFRLMLALRYNSKECDIEYGALNVHGVRTCSYHKDEKLTLQHIISCPYAMKRYVIEQHDRIAQVIKRIIKRKEEVSDDHRERYSENQKTRKENNEQAHRADILYMLKGVPHSVDIIVTSSNNNNKGNNATRAWGVKNREYGNEKNLHIVLFDTAGNVAEASWTYLTKMGVRSDDLRTIQKIIYDCTNRRIKAIVDEAKYGTNDGMTSSNE